MASELTPIPTIFPSSARAPAQRCAPDGARHALSKPTRHIPRENRVAEEWSSLLARTASACFRLTAGRTTWLPSHTDLQHLRKDTKRQSAWRPPALRRAFVPTKTSAASACPTEHIGNTPAIMPVRSLFPKAPSETRDMGRYCATEPSRSQIQLRPSPRLAGMTLYPRQLT